MINAGLTGGIASGKSTVSGFFKHLGAVIVDADRIAREVVAKGLPAWEKIVDRFGTKVLLPNGEIDRKELGRIIFRDPGEKEALNRIVHPFVFDEMAGRISWIRRNRPETVMIQDVPLLIESGMHLRVDRVILVYVPEEVQLRRLMERDAVSEADARARIASQIPIEEKKRWADFVIDNRRSLEETRRQTRAIYDALKHEADSMVAPVNS